MRLYFLRHATASDVAPNDQLRELTNEGRDEARIAGAALSALEVKPSHILSSPLVRANQTATIVAKALGFRGAIESTDTLKNGVPTRELLKTLKAYGPETELLLVGHMPSLSEHIAHLVGCRNAEGIPLGKGGVACVELEQVRQDRGQLRWLLRQKQLKRIAR